MTSPTGSINSFVQKTINTGPRAFKKTAKTIERHAKIVDRWQKEHPQEKGSGKILRYENEISVYKAKVDEAIKEFKNDLNETPSADTKKKICLFIEKISLLPDTVFDRSEIHESSLLGELIAPEITKTIKRLRKEKKTKGPEENESLDAKIHREQHMIARKIAKSKFADKLGAGTFVAKGATGTKLKFRAGGAKGKTLVGVLKPSAKTTPIITRIKNFLKRFIGQLSLLSQGNLSQPQAEMASYLIDRFFDFNVVPAAKLIGEEGVFQLAAQTHLKHKKTLTDKAGEIKLKEAAEVPELLQRTDKSFTSAELNAFQKFAIHDFLIGNLDAHDENWFVHQISEESEEINDIIGIDKANSFLRKNPKLSISPAARNQYKWGTKPVASKPFTEDAKTMLRELTPKRVDEAIVFIEKQEGMNNFFDDAMKARLP